ncbi:GNAT family N-acetyltransferase [Salinifilum aidingensis]
MRVLRVPYDHPDASRLIAAVQAEYLQRYGEQDVSAVDPAEFAPPRGAFFLGYVDGAAAVSGGWRLRTDLPGGSGRDAEIKRMYTAPWARGRGLARTVLGEVESSAGLAGCKRAVLETGVHQPEALALYDSAGYAPIAPFGAYAADAESRFFGKEI